MTLEWPRFDQSGLGLLFVAPAQEPICGLLVRHYLAPAGRQSRNRAFLCFPTKSSVGLCRLEQFSPAERNRIMSAKLPWLISAIFLSSSVLAFPQAAIQVGPSSSAGVQVSGP